MKRSEGVDFSTPVVCRSVGLLVCRSVGLLVCRSVSLSVCWSVSLSPVSLLVCWYVSLSVCWSVGMLVSRSVGLLVCWSVGLLVCCYILHLQVGLFFSYFNFFPTCPFSFIAFRPVTFSGVFISLFLSSRVRTLTHTSSSHS